MEPDSMSPCFRGCGEWIPSDGPAVCRSCRRGGTEPGWERRLLTGRIEEKARDWQRTASRFEGRIRHMRNGDYARAAAIYIGRLRMAADLMSRPVTDAEWTAGIATPPAVVDDPYGHEEAE